MGLELVRFTKETTYGTFVGSSPAAGTQYDLFLPTGDDMTVRVEPKFWMIRDAGQGNRLVKKNVGRKSVGGGISTLLFPSQAPFIVGLGTGLTGTAPCYDLPSFTVDHVIYTDGCAVIGKRYLGCKFADFSLSCSDSDSDPMVMVKGSIIGSVAEDITLTDFPNPNLSAYPGDDPYLIYNTAENTGALVIGTTRHNYKNLQVDIKNVVKPFGGEQRFNQLVGYFGRDVSFSTTVLHASNADRAAYEAGTKEAVSVTFDNGTNKCKLDFGTNVNFDAVRDRHPLDDYFLQDLSFSSLLDPTTGPPATDLAVTFT